jgi:hypothetical protein
VRRGVWSAVLLLPEPPLALAYLLAVRAERVAPAFGPVAALALFPLAAVAVAVRGLGGARWVVLGLAVVELASLVVVAGMIGFAKAWRSG